MINYDNKMIFCFLIRTNCISLYPYFLFGTTFCSNKRLRSTPLSHIHAKECTHMFCLDHSAHFLCSFTPSFILMCTNSTYKQGHTQGDEQKPHTESEKLQRGLFHVCVCQVINSSVFLGGFGTWQPEGFNLNVLLFSSP